MGYFWRVYRSDLCVSVDEIDADEVAVVEGSLIFYKDNKKVVIMAPGTWLRVLRVEEKSAE
jgi:hypothetical protein